MSAWWTYRPSDFLMFAPRTYWRLFELQNAQWWPVHLLVWTGAALCIAIALRQAGRDRGLPVRAAVACLAVLWGFVGLTFMLGRYAPINWAAAGFAALFGLGAAGLTLLATRPDLRVTPIGNSRVVAGLLLAVALVGYPIATPVFGRPWAQAELLGLAPDPTAVATLGLLIGICAQRAMTAWLLWGLRALAVAWCLISLATLATMQANEAWILVVVIFAAVAQLRRSGRQQALSEDQNNVL